MCNRPFGLIQIARNGARKPPTLLVYCHHQYIRTIYQDKGLDMASTSSVTFRSIASIGLNRRLVIPILVGVLGALLLSGVYLGIVTLAQGWKHAVELLWEDKFLVAPIVAGFGTQVGLYTFLKVGRHTTVRGAGAMAGAGGGTSTAAMVACCTHHVTDILPLVGLSAATTFLANYKVPFMLIGLAMNLVGIGIALRAIRKARLSFQLSPIEE